MEYYRNVLERYYLSRMHEMFELRTDFHNDCQVSRSCEDAFIHSLPELMVVQTQAPFDKIVNIKFNL